MDEHMVDSFDVLVMGNSIAGSLMAAYVKQEQPRLRVGLLGPTSQKQPVVGESLIEMSTQMLMRLGLGGYLEEEQFHKYGLTFYFKKNIDDPSCRRYFVHEGPAGPPLPSFQLNRVRLKKRLDRLTQDLGVVPIVGKAQRVDVQSPSGFVVGTAGGTRRLRARYVVDATGRRRLLARQWGYAVPAPMQRSAFWFRLEGFDRHFLRHIEAIKRPQYHADSYFCTHHFMGRGKWVWCIPLKQSSGAPCLMSVGLTWRPDLVEGTVHSPEDFLAAVGPEHPVVCDLVRSGHVVDTCSYDDYMVDVRNVYSRVGWFILGDAGKSVDPLYSTGLAFTAAQIQQIEAMIANGERCGAIDPDFVAACEGCHQALFRIFQESISHQYVSMHHPYPCSWTMHLLTLSYFYGVLPLWLAGYHTDPMGARLMTGMMTQGRRDMASLVALVDRAHHRLGLAATQGLGNRYDESVNWELWGPCEEDIPRHLTRMLSSLVRYRLRLLKDAGFAGWPSHARIMLADGLKYAFFRTLHGRRLRDIPWVRYALT